MERSYSRYLLVVLCVSITVTAVVLVALNAYANSKRPAPSGPASDQEITTAYRAGFNAARERLTKYGFGAPSDTQTLTGTVRSVSGGKLIVSQENLMTDALISGITDDREVTTTASTKITRDVQKPAAQFQAEQEAFAKLPPSPSLQPPTATIKSTIRISDINVGDHVTISAQESDITMLPSITAASISVQ